MTCPGCRDEQISPEESVCDSCLHSQPEDWVRRTIPQCVRDAQIANGIVALKDGQMCAQQMEMTCQI